MRLGAANLTQTLHVRPARDPQRRRIRRTVLALMHLTTHQGGFGWRAWESFPWEATDGLYERGLIGGPKSKATSVALTDEGARLAKQLFTEMFGVEDTDAD